MSVFPFYTPRFVVKNISHKSVRVMDQLTLRPGEQKDLFKAFDPLDLSEDTILKSLEKPWGDLYREVVEKGSLEIVDIFLISWNYSLVRPSNIVAGVGTPEIGKILTIASDNTFGWSDAPEITNVAYPLSLEDGTVVLQPADATHDGYLTKEDWALFSAGVAGIAHRRRQKIWQYQDFDAPVVNNLVISAFENGTDFPFDESYIVNDTAQIVQVNDTSAPPTTTISAPGRWLPNNRVVVTSQVGPTITLNQTPAATQGCRVFFQISVPPDIQLPIDYIEDPNFLNKGSTDFLDSNYVNQNQDESVFGQKTFESQARFNANVGIGLNPSEALDVLGTIQTTGLRITTSAVDGYFLKSDSSGNASWAPVLTNAYVVIEKDGVDLTPRSTLNFIGSAIVATDGGTRTNIALVQLPADSSAVVGSTRRINTILPLIGGEDLFSDLTLSMPIATAVQDGYLSSTDFAAFSAKLTSPLTTKGDLLTRDISVHVRQPAGRDGYVLSADSTQSTGLKWVHPSLAGVGSPSDTVSVSPTAPSTEDPGQLWLKTPEYELFSFDAARGKWLSARTAEMSGSRNSSAATDLYLRTYDGAPTNQAPFVVPFDSTLIAMSASSAAVQDWSAELRINEVVVTGAGITIVSSASQISTNLNVDFAAGEAIQIFMNGTNIQFPRVNCFFARRG